MPKLTPEEKIHKKQRHSLDVLCNRIGSAFNFKQVSTWGDIFRMEGMSNADIATAFPEHQHDKVVYADLKKHFDELKARLESSINGIVKEVNVEKTTDLIIDSSKQPTITPPATAFVETKEAAIEHLTGDNDYGLHKSEKEKAFLFWFQKKATKELYDKVVVQMLRGVMLLASTGTGKTYIAGALVRRLIDVGFADDKTYGHVKYLYVTRASIVEQTKRVFEKSFGITIKDGVEILNIEQLRSRAGALWIKEEIKIVGGEEVIEYKWAKNRNPVVILLDECQGVKNDGSIQSRIIQSFSEIESSHTVVVFISATPFTRIIEAKAFVLNCHYTDTEMSLA